MFKKSKEFQCCLVYLSNASINSKSNSDIHFLLKFQTKKCDIERKAGTFLLETMFALSCICQYSITP